MTDDISCIVSWLIIRVDTSTVSEKCRVIMPVFMSRSKLFSLGRTLSSMNILALTLRASAVEMRTRLLPFISLTRSEEKLKYVVLAFLSRVSSCLIALRSSSDT